MGTQTNVQSTVRESTPADKEGIFELREAVYNESFEPEEWHWKFERHSGVPAKIYVAEAGEKIVGLRAFVVERLKILDKVWLTGLGVDIMVHPDFRRYGIASQVANEAAVQMERAGMPVLVGFPNEAAFKVYSRRRSNWRHVCSIPLLVKPLNFDGILRKYIRNPLIRTLIKLPAWISWKILFHGRLRLPEGFTVRRAADFDERFDTLWRELREQYGILLERDKAFLHWRFTEKPGAEYVVFVAEQDDKLLGYIVLREDRMFGLKVGFILDILAVNQNATDALLSQSIQYHQQQGADAIGCLMLQHTPYFKSLRRCGFVIAPKRLIQKEFYFGVQVTPSTISDEIINRRKNWFLTFADTDLV